MPQYGSKKSALMALKRYFTGDISIDPSEGSFLSPAEDSLVGALCQLIDERQESRDQKFGQKFDFPRERAYRHLKSIARCLKLFPISDEIRKSYEVRGRMGFKIGTLTYSENRNRYSGKIKIRWQIVPEVIRENFKNENSI